MVLAVALALGDGGVVVLVFERGTLESAGLIVKRSARIEDEVRTRHAALADRQLRVVAERNKAALFHFGDLAVGIELEAALLGHGETIGIKLAGERNGVLDGEAFGNRKRTRVLEPAVFHDAKILEGYFRAEAAHGVVVADDRQIVDVELAAVDGDLTDREIVERNRTAVVELKRLLDAEFARLVAFVQGVLIGHGAVDGHVLKLDGAAHDHGAACGHRHGVRAEAAEVVRTFGTHVVELAVDGDVADAGDRLVVREGLAGSHGEFVEAFDAALFGAGTSVGEVFIEHQGAVFAKPLEGAVVREERTHRHLVGADRALVAALAKEEEFLVRIRTVERLGIMNRQVVERRFGAGMVLEDAVDIGVLGRQGLVVDEDARMVGLGADVERTVHVEGALVHDDAVVVDHAVGAFGLADRDRTFLSIPEHAGEVRVIHDAVVLDEREALLNDEAALVDGEVGVARRLAVRELARGKHDGFDRQVLVVMDADGGSREVLDSGRAVVGKEAVGKGAHTAHVLTHGALIRADVELALVRETFPAIRGLEAGLDRIDRDLGGADDNDVVARMKRADFQSGVVDAHHARLVRLVKLALTVFRHVDEDLIDLLGKGGLRAVRGTDLENGCLIEAGAADDDETIHVAEVNLVAREREAVSARDVCRRGCARDAAQNLVFGELEAVRELVAARLEEVVEMVAFVVDRIMVARIQDFGARSAGKCGDGNGHSRDDGLDGLAARGGRACLFVDGNVGLLGRRPNHSIDIVHEKTFWLEKMVSRGARRCDKPRLASEVCVRD